MYCGALSAFAALFDRALTLRRVQHGATVLAGRVDTARLLYAACVAGVERQADPDDAGDRQDGA